MDSISAPINVAHVSSASAASAAAAAQNGAGMPRAPVKQGFLHKRGKKPYIKTLKLRWFVLEDDALTYHKKPGAPALGTIPMNQVINVAPAESATDPFLFTLTHESDDAQRVYFFRARSLPEMEEWMDALRRSIAYHTSSSPAAALAAASALNAAFHNSASISAAASAAVPSAAAAIAAAATMAPISASPTQSTPPVTPRGRPAASSVSSQTSYSSSSSASSSPHTSGTVDPDILERYQARELEVKELEKAFREAKEELEAEKRKTLFILEKEQKNIKQLQQERNSLKLEIQRLQQLLGDRGQGSDPTATGEDEMQRLRRDIQEKQEALESMKRELENYTKVQLLFEQGGDTHDPGQIIEMLKVQMVEMKSLLESKVTELKTKLEAEANEKKKTEADAAQWKAMAQKELKTRLQLESEKSALHRELQEAKRQSQLMRSGLVEQMQLDDNEDAKEHHHSSKRNSGNWRSSQRRSGGATQDSIFQEPLLDDGEPGDGDVSIWTPNSRARPGPGPRSYASSTCFNCTLQ